MHLPAVPKHVWWIRWLEVLCTSHAAPQSCLWVWWFNTCMSCGSPQVLVNLKSVTMHLPCGSPALLVKLMMGAVHFLRLPYVCCWMWWTKICTTYGCPTCLMSLTIDIWIRPSAPQTCLVILMMQYALFLRMIETSQPDNTSTKRHCNLPTNEALDFYPRKWCYSVYTNIIIELKVTQFLHCGLLSKIIISNQ